MAEQNIVRVRYAYVPTKKGQPYTDDEMRRILSCAPTRANASRLAAELKRWPKATELIYRMAARPTDELRRGRVWQRKNAHIERIIRIRKELGWLAVGGDTRAREA